MTNPRGSLLAAGILAGVTILCAGTAEAQEPGATGTGTATGPVYSANPAAPTGYLPPKLSWNKGDPVPPGYTPSTEIREGFVIAGAVTLGVSWVFGGLLPGIGLLAACGAVNSAGGQT